MKIGSLNTANNVFLAPLAGVSDLPFRLLCKEQGSGMLCTEMVSAKGICFQNANTLLLLQISPEEHPVGVQLFGREPDILAKAVQMIEHLPFDFIDINMGCPAPKIFNNGEGSALMKEPKLVGEIVKAVAGSTKKPVTVKIRKGVDENSVNAVETAKIIEQNGGAAVAVHGRLRQQYYSGAADWDIIAQVKRSVSVPVIGNGDVGSPQSARDMLAYTGCDAVMVGRAAMGNPWIFKQMNHFLQTGQLLGEPGIAEKVTMALRHGEMLVNYKGEVIGVKEMRKHLAWYTKGLPNSAHIRMEINQAETLEGMKAILMNLFESSGAPSLGVSHF